MISDETTPLATGRPVGWGRSAAGGRRARIRLVVRMPSQRGWCGGRTPSISHMCREGPHGLLHDCPHCHSESGASAPCASREGWGCIITQPAAPNHTRMVAPFVCQVRLQISAQSSWQAAGSVQQVWLGQLGWAEALR